MMKYHIQIILISCILFVNNIGKAANIDAYRASESPTIDGIGTEVCWQAASWVVLDQVWVGRAPTAENCSARYKACWKGSKIYILMEVVDNILVNWNPTEPLNNYSSNDCPELFIDEDNSGGDHEKNYNAFAYHISTLYDVVDMDVDGSPKLYNNHIEVKRKNSGNTYTWEMALTVYTDKFVYGATANPISLLEVGKVLGFTAAYNDSDTKINAREAMLASVEIQPWMCSNLGYASSGVNCSWQTASVFGKMTLKDAPLNTQEAWQGNGLTVVRADSGVHIYGNDSKVAMMGKLYDLKGRLLKQVVVSSEYVPFEGLVKGSVYVLVLEHAGKESRHKIIW